MAESHLLLVGRQRLRAPLGNAMRPQIINLGIALVLDATWDPVRVELWVMTGDVRVRVDDEYCLGTG